MALVLVLVLGGSLRYAAPAWGLQVEAGGQGTLVPGEWQFREWGVSGSLQFDPGTAGRGLAVQVAPAWGGPGTSADALWTLADTDGLAAAEPPTPAARVEAKLSYGFDWATPYAALSLEPGGARAPASEARPERGGNASRARRRP